MTFNLDMQNHSAIATSDLSMNPALDWLSSYQNESLKSFSNMPLPNRKIEHFKYNDLTFLKQMSFELQSNFGGTSIEDSHSIEIENSLEIIVVNGSICTELSSLELPDGLTIKKLSDCDELERTLIKEKLEVNQKNLLLNLNSALTQEGLFISVEKSTIIEKPVYIRNITANAASGNLNTNLVFVNLEMNSELSVIEHFESEPSEEIKLNLQQSFFKLAANSRANLYRLNLEKESAYQASQVKSFLDRDSVFNGFFLGLGSKLNRTDLDVLHQGQNAHCDLTGVYLPANEQAIDYHTNIEHQIPHCTSNEVFRGIIADKASATFNGKIHIFKDAQKSDAFLNNKNLLLTNEAEINTKPELEIYADDVKCAHGATVAQLDDKSVYYLQTRGIERKKARKMLSIAFIQELIDTIKLESVREFVKARLDEYMSHLDKR